MSHEAYVTIRILLWALTGLGVFYVVLSDDVRDRLLAAILTTSAILGLLL